MGFSKDIKAGPAMISIAEEGGVATLKVSVDQSLGGGSAAGILKAKVAAEVDMGAQQAADLGLALIEAKFPALKPFIDSTIKPAVDAELAKV